MKSTRTAIYILAVLLALSNATYAQAVIQRFVLIAGANSGGSDRPLLRYAVSDADRFARVLVDLGGVSTPDAMVLKDPKVRNLVESLNWLNQRVSEARRAAGAGKSRTEVLFYYSGHADEKGLLLGDDRYSYQSLRDRLDEIPADVRIAVLDACASGAFTRLKGGKVRKPFVVDEATDMHGHAFLTSSAETEAAQESDSLGASYFTHYLVSGLRGAADVNADGKITLNEAYQFAFQETLGRTVNSQGGAQHPSYDIKLSGTGDVTMTDVRQTTATLALAPTLEGRIFVRNARQELVVELYKAQGRKVDLGLEPGAYDVRIERPSEAWLAKSQLADGQRLELGLDQFSPTKPEPSRRRGFGPPSFSVAGRNRFELRFGMWRAGSSPPQAAQAFVEAKAVDFLGGLQYTRFVSEKLAATLGATTLSVNESTISTSGVSGGSAAITTLNLGMRWNPLKGEFRTRAVKPYLAVGFGPVIGARSGISGRLGSAFVEAQTAATVGGHTGAGVDVFLGRSWSIGVSAGYNWMADFSKTIGGHNNYSGFEAAVNLGWVFGKGYGPRN
jgi:hypothetical protein